MGEITEYLDNKGIQYHIEGIEVVTVCPTCRKEKLYINQQSLLYQCFVCKTENPESKYAKGHFSSYIKDMGDVMAITPIALPTKQKKKDQNFTELVTRYNHALSKNKMGLKYLYSRGFNETDIDFFQFGYAEFEKESWISIPAYENGIPVLIKYRKITNNTDAKKYRREFGSKSILYNQDCLKNNDEVYVCAGEFDAACMIKHGYDNTVAGTGGEGTLTSDMYDTLYLKDKFTLILDADAAGQVAARDVWAKRLGVGRCLNVKLPDDEDVNSFINEYGIEEFEIYLNNAHKFKVDGIISLVDALFQMHDRYTGTTEVFSLPWESVNSKIGGGFERKQLIVLGGQAGVGKTSGALQIGHHFVIEHKMPSLTVCLEMAEDKLATKIVQLHLDLDYNDINPNHALAYAQELEGVEMYFGYSPVITPELYYNTVKEARNRYGCELFIFDNLQLLVVSDKESDYAKAVKMFKRIAMELDVIMLLVSQPRKLNSERNPTYDDLKGSASISQGADTVILTHRKRQDKDGDGHESFVEKTSFIVDKARFASGGKTSLKFVGNKSRFEEYTNKMEFY